MTDALIIALEAAWELDPIRLENKLWDTIAKNEKICYSKCVSKGSVEHLSNDNRWDIQTREVSDFKP